MPMTHIFTQFQDDSKQALEKLSACITGIKLWCANKLQLNDNKTEFYSPFYQFSFRPDTPSRTINNQILTLSYEKSRCNIRLHYVHVTARHIDMLISQLSPTQ